MANFHGIRNQGPADEKDSGDAGSSPPKKARRSAGSCPTEPETGKRYLEAAEPTGRDEHVPPLWSGVESITLETQLRMRREKLRSDRKRAELWKAAWEGIWPWRGCPG